MSDGTERAGAALAGTSTGPGAAGALIVERADFAIATVDAPRLEAAAAARRLGGRGAERDGGEGTGSADAGRRAGGGA